MTSGDIFPQTPEESERPTDYVANPLRVYTGAKYRDRSFIRIDLVALANGVVAREVEARQMAERLREASRRIAALENEIARLRAEANPETLRRVVRAMRDALGETEDGESDDGPLCSCSDCTMHG